jgi:hypothetical protein
MNATNFNDQSTTSNQLNSSSYVAINMQMLFNAAANCNLDRALAPLQQAAGIESGDLAGIFFTGPEGDEWECASESQRLSLLTRYFIFERNAVTHSRPKVAMLNARYAESIIEDRKDFYDALEIHGVRDLNGPDDKNGSCVEIDNEHAEFFAVYVRVKQYDDHGGVECVGDFGNYALASQYAQELAKQYHWPVIDLIGQRLKHADLHPAVPSLNSYRYRFHACCPVNGQEIEYDLVIVSQKMIRVEDIIALADQHRVGFHEQIADAFFDAFGGNQTMSAHHHGVDITSTRRPGQSA